MAKKTTRNQEDRQPIQLTLDKKTARIALTGKQVIFDEEFNYARQVQPQHDDGTPHTLSLSVNANTPLGCVAQDIWVRRATKEEMDRWYELHSKDEWVQEAVAASGKRYTPIYIIADGFGRMVSHVEEYGMDEVIEAKLLDTDDPLEGAFLGIFLGYHSRGSHPLDIYNIVQRVKKERNLTNAIVAEQLGISGAYLSRIMKVGRLNKGDMAKAKKERWSLNHICKVVDNYNKDGKQTEGTVAPKTGKKPTAKTRNNFIDHIAPHLLGDAPVELPEDSEYSGIRVTEDYEDYDALRIAQLVLEWSDGRHVITRGKDKGKPQPLLDVLKEYGYCESTDIDFDALAKQITEAKK